MGPKPRVDIFFDVISPYSWIGFEALTRYANVWPIELRHRPFSFPGVIKETKNTGAPMLHPIKAEYLHEDMPRAGRHWGMEIRLPPNFDKLVVTKSAVRVQRLLASFEEKTPELIVPTARAFWKRLYVENKSIFEDSDILEVMKILDFEGPEKKLEYSNSDEVRAKLRATTKEALDTGCFGAPWIVVHTENGIEKFFGSDRMPVIADVLRLPYNGPIKNV